jgi:hypothetical protein
MTEAEREEFSALLEAYSAHLKGMIAFMKPISSLPELLPAALNADTRPVIKDLIERQLPAMQSTLTEMRDATPPPFLQAIHQSLVGGLGHMVSGAEQVQSSVLLEATRETDSAYRGGRRGLNNGVGLTAKAQKAMNVKLGEVLRKLR